MYENRNCGNCKHMDNQDLDGFGWCERTTTETHCALCCDCYEGLNGWTEITPDNEEEVYDIPPERLVIANIINGLVFYSSYNDMSMSIVSMAKHGGYWYYVLPELKIE